MMYYYYNNNFFPFHMFGYGFMFIFWLIVIFVLIFIFKKNTSIENKHNNAIEILKERYAKGEINKEQFEQMKKDLR